MGNIGEDEKGVEFLPLTEPRPVEEPTPELEPIHEPLPGPDRREEVPA